MLSPSSSKPTHRTRASPLVKKTYYGKLITQWNEGISKLANKLERIDMGPALSTMIAVKNEDEQVSLPIDAR